MSLGSFFARLCCLKAARQSRPAPRTVQRKLNVELLEDRVVPSTIFSPTSVPVVASDSDSSAVELGVKFQSSQTGTITGLRFYKSLGNIGTHLGDLYTSSGQLL